MNLKLCTGYSVGNFQIEKFLKVSADLQVESYIVKDANGQKGLMKISRTIRPCGILECTATSQGEDNYPLLSNLAVGRVMVEGEDYDYTVREYVEGERLSDILEGGKIFTWEEALPIYYQLLIALKHLHSCSPSIIHNDITTRNVLIKEIDGRYRVYVIGMGHISHVVTGKAPFYTKDLNSLYRAPETFKGIYNVKTDLYSSGVLLYAMLSGGNIWGFSDNQGVITRQQLKDTWPFVNTFINYKPLEKYQKLILAKLLEVDYDKRYDNVDSVLRSLRWNEDAPVAKNKGNGFAEVAGMDDLKRMLMRDVMFVLQNRDKAEKYKLSLPNGALFYGPPGCGKTFLAEKFAEESNLNFMMVKASDLGSVYIHGTQGKIAELFSKAADNAPTVLCFDELDGMVPDRSHIQNEGASGEVNEFLSQLNNCSQKGIFVIGTTNRPDKIDPAVLRTGRMDKLVYVPVPDKDARCEIFKIQLEGRYCDDSINYDDLASHTQGYVASDISFIINQSALAAAISDVPISQELIIEEIANTRCSVTPDSLLKYESMKQALEQRKTDKRRSKIGFKTN